MRNEDDPGNTDPFWTEGPTDKRAGWSRYEWTEWLEGKLVESVGMDRRGVELDRSGKDRLVANWIALRGRPLADVWNEDIEPFFDEVGGSGLTADEVMSAGEKRVVFRGFVDRVFGEVKVDYVTEKTVGSIPVMWQFLEEVEEICGDWGIELEGWVKRGMPVIEWGQNGLQFGVAPIVDDEVGIGVLEKDKGSEGMWRLRNELAQREVAQLLKRAEFEPILWYSLAGAYTEKIWEDMWWFKKELLSKGLEESSEELRGRMFDLLVAETRMGSVRVSFSLAEEESEHSVLSEYQVSLADSDEVVLVLDERVAEGIEGPDKNRVLVRWGDNGLSYGVVQDEGVVWCSPERFVSQGLVREERAAVRSGIRFFENVRSYPDTVMLRVPKEVRAGMLDELERLNDLSKIFGFVSELYGFVEYRLLDGETNVN